MSSKLRSLIALSCLAPAGAMADATTVYGRINISAQQNSIESLQFVSASDTVTTTDVSTTTLENNASRLGFKGSEKFADIGLEGFYQAEFAVYPDDGVEGAESSTIRQRDIFLGIKGGFGAVQAGNFDTPLKKIQNKVDVFNDLQGDINNYITVNDYRRKNSVMYTTPKMNGFVGYIDLILSEGNSKKEEPVSKEKGYENAASLALSYENGGFYSAVAYDKNVVIVEANTLQNDESQVYRLVAQYTLGAWQFGALYDNHDASTYSKVTVAGVDSLVEKENQGSGWIVSSQYTLGQWALKAQYGQTDILRGAEVDRDADVLSIGADFKLSKSTRLYGFYTTESADISWQKTKSTGIVTASQGNDYLGFGGELVF
jgi:predicted porin